MAEFARCFVDPVPMAVETLLMVRTFQARLVDVGAGRRAFMAGAARRRRSGERRVMMASRAPVSHLGHGGVPAVIERYGQARAVKRVQDDHVRRFRSQLGLDGKSLARFDQTEIERTRAVAVMATAAVSWQFRNCRRLARRRGRFRGRSLESLSEAG